MHTVPFVPHALLRNGHLQTICGNYWPDRWACPHSQRHRVELPDGDALVLHENDPAIPAVPVAVLLVHGLGGSHASAYVRRTAAKLNQRGIRTFRIDLRGHGEATLTAARPGHAGRSEDVRAAAENIHRRWPELQLAVVGFSLGGNIVLKFAAECSAAPPPWLKKVLAVAPPIDLECCSANLATRRGRWYDRLFVQAAVKRVTYLHRHGVLPGELPRRWPSRLRDFDDCFTAPRSGFRDVADYYARCSSAPHLTAITTPTTILAAADDPIVPAEMFEGREFSAATQFILTSHGGHLGYLGRRSSDADRHWLDWRIVEWVLQCND